ncbi:MAG TPA: bifunctional alpha,alpha-trehalose-phosphate synthase (UDP-forming)/trehalose-phosphatase [Vicinamibacterales bacterium]|nr:bifunctional alpha,alpha-trehalose-phosphate synthase (UDP-forming)/trehalose-phosphatase [Vicinamibacterales bacterium]
MNPRPGRLLIVSNRLPVTINDIDGAFTFEPSAGGLATGVRAAHEAGRDLWFGWPGAGLDSSRARREVLGRQLRERGLVPIHLSAQDVRQYYDGYSNGALWPLFHYLLDRVPLAARDWAAYCRVNERFAEEVASHYHRGDLVWVHDYHLMLVPALLRTRLPDAAIAFFLHVPFPSSELFRILPNRRALLDGVLGADLVGFHTHAYLRHFVVALRHVAALDPVGDTLVRDGRRIRLGCFPMGVDSTRFQALAEDARVAEEAVRLRTESGPRRILLGVDRLDYTKGIPRRLLAFERFLEKNPAAADHVRLVQLAIPSRGGDDAYKAFRRQVEGIVGRVNGRFGSLESVPIHYLHRAVSRETLVAMFRAADVMLVTPLRDGMNLVAKEFVASRVDDGGVLVLSEFAGAAAELREAILVNPFDVEGTADAIGRALALDAADVRTRMSSMRKRVMGQDVHHWTRTFLHALKDAAAARDAGPASRDSLAALGRQIDLLVRTGPVALLLDYDGTLVPFAATPALAKPDAELVALLRWAARMPGLELHVVSGRPPAQLDEWFGGLPISRWAEHGLWSRPAGADEWVRTVSPTLDWMTEAEHLLERACADTPGSFIERKSASLAWHYRLADTQLGIERANRLDALLRKRLANAPVGVLKGSYVLEVRAAGVHKGLVVERVLGRRAPSAAVVAIGDDETDEDMFAAVQEPGLTVHVGPGDTRASARLEDWQAVRVLLTIVTSGHVPEPGPTLSQEDLG